MFPVLWKVWNLSYLVTDQFEGEQATLEAKARSSEWQIQAQAVALVNKRRLWLDWHKQDGTPYASFLDWCGELGWSGTSGYRRVRFATHKYFPRILNLNISMVFAEKLFEMEDELFEISIALIEYGYSEEHVSELLENSDMLNTILAFVERQFILLSRVQEMAIALQARQQEK